MPHVSHLESYLEPKVSAMDNNEGVVNLFVLNAHLLPAGKITVPVSNKIEGILNKHWHIFLKYG